MKIKEFIKGLFVSLGHDHAEPPVAQPQADPEPVKLETPRPVSTDGQWFPYAPGSKPKTTGWYVVVYGTRSQVKWYNAELDQWAKIPLRYPVTFYLKLPPIPVIGHPLDKED